jgi:hypothetical protein
MQDRPSLRLEGETRIEGLKKESKLRTYPFMIPLDRRRGWNYCMWNFVRNWKKELKCWSVDGCCDVGVKEKKRKSC